MGADLATQHGCRFCSVCSTDQYSGNNKQSRKMNSSLKTTLLQQISCDDTYYAKCTDLICKISSSTNTSDIIQHDDSDHSNNWEYVRGMAEVCKNPLDEFCNNLVNSSKSFSTNENDSKTNDEPIEVIKAFLTNVEQATEQVEKEYNGNWLRLINICQSNIIHNNFKDLYFMLLILAKYNQIFCSFKVISIHNKYNDNGHIILYVKPVNISNDLTINENEMNLEITKDEKQVLESLKTKQYNMNNQESINAYDDDKCSSMPGHICEITIVHKEIYNYKEEKISNVDPVIMEP